MRIISLELQGFKSFPDKTAIQFDSGVTIIVGPNGSGKSNISDAIRWVLGEISTKNIRGTKMEDVIFGGTDTRRGMGYAEVSLTIDNSDPKNRMAIDYDLVTLTRRYYRTGESEYYINGKNVRLKDISEMFMNTGIGRSGYSVIGQGKIAEIISQNSEERRIIFEEAAGIAKYKYKKRESERKLEKTCENLVRVTDILSELQDRVTPLEKEAAKARAYLDLYEDKKQADVSLWLYDLAETRKQYEQIDAAFTLSKKALEISDDEIKAIENQNEALYLTIQNTKAQMDATDRRIKEITGQFHELESSGKVLENDTQHISAQIEDLRTEQQAAEDRFAELTKQQGEQQKKHEQEKEALTALDTELKTCTLRLDERKNTLYQMQEAFDQLSAEYTETNSRLVELRATAASLEARPKEEILKTEQRRNECREHIDCLTLGAEKASKTIAEYAAKIADIESDISKTQQIEYQPKAALLQEKTKQKNENELKRASLNQKLITLKKMAEHFDGYAHSVKFVMDAHIDGVIGPISSIIKTEKRFALAIETALGNKIQNIVVQTEETAKAAIELLKENGAGRATFFPISTVTAPPLNVDRQTIEKSGGFIGYANQLVEHDAVYDAIIENLLGRTVVFDTLTHAIEMEKRLGFKIKCVTLDGQVINTGGSFTGGAVKKESGILSRNAVMDGLKAEIEELEKQSKILNLDIKECQSAIDKFHAYKQDAENTIALLNQLKQAEDTQKQVLTAQIAAEKEQLSLLCETLASFQNEEEARQKELDHLWSQIELKENQAKALSRSIEEAKAKCSQENAELSQSVDYKNQVLIKISAKEKDVTAAADQISHSDSLLLRAKEELDKYEEQSKALKMRLSQNKAKLKSNEQVKTSSKEELNHLYERSAQLKEQSADQDVQMNRLRKRFMDKTHERELQYRECTNLESRHTQIAAKQESMSARLWDEYELTYSAALALDYPQVTAQNRAEIAGKVNEYKSRMKTLGHVNVGAIEEYAEVKQRYDFLTKQVSDLNDSKQDLSAVISKLETEMKNKFAQAMKEINDHFKVVFKDLFGGGNAELVLTDPEHILESGIEINVAPPGKIIKNLQLLSGGEQVFVAIALYFAILKVNPTPFCLLDEIEAALDEVNVSKFAQYTKRLASKTQFIIITHRRGTMEVADTIYGVTMQERGISKILSINVNEAEKKLGVKLV